MAPVVIESSDLNWSSNTTLDVNSDIYVANRGNNTTVLNAHPERHGRGDMLVMRGGGMGFERCAFA